MKKNAIRRWTDGNRLMASESPPNPYSVGTGLEQSEFAWADGDVEFTETDIRVRGDFELPQICIHLGTSDNLIRRERTLSFLSPLFNWIHKGSGFIEWSAMPALGVLAVVEKQNLVSPAFERTIFYFVLGLMFVSATVQFLVARTGKSINVTWNLSQSYTATKERWFLLRTLCTIALGLTWIYLSESVFLPCVVAGLFVFADLKRQPAMTARHLINGRFVLTGHTAEFAKAWAALVEGTESDTLQQISTDD